MANYEKGKHDIGILRQDGSTKVGLMLAQDKNNVPQYFIDDDEFLASQFFTGVPGYGALPPEKEIAMRQDDWRSGFGLEVYESADPKRYFKAIKMDLRHRGMAICGPKATAVTLSVNTPPSITNADMELDSNWANGSQSTAQKHGGSYSMRTIAATFIYQTLTASGYQGNTYHFFGFVWADTASRARLSVYDGKSSTDSSYHTGGSSWEILSVTKTFAADATEFTVGMESVGGAFVYFDDVYLATSAYPKAFANFNDYLYIGSGNCLFKVDKTTGAVSFIHACPATITDLEPFIDDKLYIAFGSIASKLAADITYAATSFDVDDASSFPSPNFYLSIESEIVQVTNVSSNTLTVTRGQQGTSAAAHSKGTDVYCGNKYWYMDTSEGFTESTDPRGTAEFFCAVENTLWKASLPRMLSSATDPTNPSSNTNWSGSTIVDTATYNILDLFTNGTSLYIKKQDRTFYLDSAGAVKVLIEETKHLAGDTTGKNAIVWQGKVYVPCGAASLVEYDAGTISWRSPSKWCNNLAAFDGRVQGIAGDEEWLFAIVDNDTEVEILAGRLEAIDGSTGWVWHPIAEITLQGCQVAFVSSVYRKALYIGSTSSSDSLYYIPLPASYGDIVSDANRSFQTGGEFWTPWLHGNFRGDPKAWIRLILEMGHTYNANRYFTVSYQEFGGSWVSIGNYTGSETSMIQSKYISVANKPDEVMVRFKFVPVTNDTTITPILKSYDCRAILYPSRRRITRTIIRCADDIKDKQGLDLGIDAATIRATLIEAANATWPVTLYDINGVTKYVRFLAARPFSQVIKWEQGRNIEEHFFLSLQEVALS